MNENFVDDDISGSEKSFVTAPDWKCNTIKNKPLSPQELTVLETKLNRIKVIQQVDQSYFMAVNDIREQLNISLLIEPSFYGRHCILSVIVIATANNTYVFDFKALGAMPKELGKLLEAESPLKIMHYSHRICDLLLHRHNLQINGICDTFVTWCLARQEQSPYTLRDVILLTFDLQPSELTCDEINSVSESQRTFAARPLSTDQLKYLGKLAILQHKLHQTLIYNNILCNLQQMWARFSCKFYEETRSDEVVLKMGPAGRAGFDCIEPQFVDDLNMELRLNDASKLVKDGLQEYTMRRYQNGDGMKKFAICGQNNIIKDGTLPDTQKEEEQNKIQLVKGNPLKLKINNDNMEVNPSGTNSKGLLNSNPLASANMSKAAVSPKWTPVIFPSACYELFISFLPKDFTKNDLKLAFFQFGNIIEARIISDKLTGRSKGYGFVAFDNLKSAETAVKAMNEYQLDNKRWLVRPNYLNNDSKTKPNMEVPHKKPRLGNTLCP